MSERIKPSIEQERDHTTLVGLDEALVLAIDDLKRGGDETRSFEMLRQILATDPDDLMHFVKRSIVLARERIGQDRSHGSFAALLGPIDAAIKVVGHRHNLFEGQNAFSINSWSVDQMKYVVTTFPEELAELAGSNTTAKNVPLRAAYILWLIDQCPAINPGSSFAFFELGSSGGLILDALKKPDEFRMWMQGHGQRSDFASKFFQGQVNSTLGIDLIVPELDWLKALIPRDDVRDQLIDFMDKFERSEVIQGNAAKLEELARIEDYLVENSNKPTFVFSISMFYQLSPSDRISAISQTRELLRKRGGGYFLLSDKAESRGIQGTDRSVAWIEDEAGNILSPKIIILNQNGTEWKTID